MKRILKIGMEVHTTNYTLCAMEPVIGEKDRVFAIISKEFRQHKSNVIRQQISTYLIPINKDFYP